MITMIMMMIAYYFADVVSLLQAYIITAVLFLVLFFCFCATTVNK